MARRIILLSGPIASGKTAISDALVSRYSFPVLRTRELLAKRIASDPRRDTLQKAGDALDHESKWQWVAKALGVMTRSLALNAVVLVDAVRTQGQIDAIRRAYGHRVVHVHLTADLDVLADRYSSKRRPGEMASYEEVRQNPTEAAVGELANTADIVIDTGRSSLEDVFTRVASRLGLYGRSVERLVDVIVGGQYGSEGKGQVAAYISPDYDLLVRVGGPNAGHKVYEEPEPITFRHLPAGTTRSEAKLAIGPGAIIRVPVLLKEIADVGIGPDRLSIDPKATIIEDVDIAFERRRLKKAIGSTGQGVGAATARKILRTDARPRVRFAEEVPRLKGYLRPARLLLEDAFARGEKVLLEGTQGTGLSLHHGQYPFVTSRDTTVSGCLAEAGIAPSRVRKIVMVCRTYPIRVGGTSGPMGQQVNLEVIAKRSGIPLAELRRIEKGSVSKKPRRIAEFNWALLRLAASLNAPTDIALTFTDYLSIQNRKARRFEQLLPETIHFIQEIERFASAPVSLIATRFNFRSIIDRRAW